MGSMKEAREQEEARAELRAILTPGHTVYTTLRHVSRSGMSRQIGVSIVQNGEIRDITGLVARACGYRLNRACDGVVIGGCGMDMGFEVVYNLSYYLSPQGFECIGQDCPSNDHSNGDRNYTPHVHKDGGYALRHRWI